MNSPNKYKSDKKAKWRYRGLILTSQEEFDEIYERYLNTFWCDECECELTIDRVRTATTKCLDHDHSITHDENVRYICCRKCNGILH